MNNKYFIYAIFVTIVSSIASWSSMIGSSKSTGTGSSWRSGSGSSYGGSSGGGHK